MISVVIPCYNEAGNVNEIFNRLSGIMCPQHEDYELLFVDDGSNDNTLSILLEIAASNPKVKILELSRNFGHQAAICAGLENAKGDAVIMMDADLQHPPELIPTLIEKWKMGYDIVYTLRQNIDSTSLLKKITAKYFYKTMNILTGIALPENSADFRLLDRKVVEHLNSLQEKTKFLRGLVMWVGFKSYPVTYKVAPRFAGSSKYSICKMLKFAFDGLTSFSAVPLHIATLLGGVVSVFSFAYAGYAIWLKLFTDAAVQGWTSVMAALLFLGGVQLLSLGIIGEYLNRIYIEVKARPAYIIRKIYCAEG